MEAEAGSPRHFFTPSDGFFIVEAAASSKITKQAQFTYKSIYFNHLADISESRSAGLGRRLAILLAARWCHLAG